MDWNDLITSDVGIKLLYGLGYHVGIVYEVVGRLFSDQICRVGLSFGRVPQIVCFYFYFILAAAVLVLLHDKLLAFQGASEHAGLLTRSIGLSQDLILLLYPLNVVIECLRHNWRPLRDHLSFT